MKIGIICNSYKLHKFEEELKKLNVKYTIESNKNGIVAISCESEQDIIQPLVDKITKYYNDLANIVRQQKLN